MSATPPDEPSRLRRLDDVLVPRLQRVARPVGRVLGLPGRLLRGLDRRLLGGRPARAAHEHRGLVAFVAVAIAFGAAAVNFQRYPQLQERARQAAEAPGVPVADGDDEDPDDDGGAGLPGAVGPVVAAAVEPYLEARREALAGAPADEERSAVVSFASFLEPGDVAALLSGLDVALVQYRLPERTPRPAEVEVGTEGVVAALDAELDALLADLEQEEAEVASTLESGVEDPAFRADYDARLDELRALRNTLRTDPAVVFAAVVRGPVGDLRDLAENPDVRLVDLLPVDVVADGVTVHGILPSDQERFTFGRSS